MFGEKLREDAVRDEQWDVVRWIWSELAAPYRLAAKVRRARERAARRRR
ncbi:hypothetical protein [Blastococcus sp. SYSU DS0539]